jgi:hypothetical protein
MQCNIDSAQSIKKLKFSFGFICCVQSLMPIHAFVIFLVMQHSLTETILFIPYNSSFDFTGLYPFGKGEDDDCQQSALNNVGAWYSQNS